MIRALTLTATFLAVATTAAAQEGAEDRQALQECLFGQPVLTAISCEGVVSTPCLAEAETDEARIACHVRELDQWEVLIDEALLPAALATAAEGDGHPDAPVAPFEDFVERAHASWVAWRRDACYLQAVRWGAGPAYDLALAECRRRMTAGHAVQLRAIAEGW